MPVWTCVLRSTVPGHGWNIPRHMLPLCNIDFVIAIRVGEWSHAVVGPSVLAAKQTPRTSMKTKNTAPAEASHTHRFEQTRNEVPHSCCWLLLWHFFNKKGTTSVWFWVCKAKLWDFVWFPVWACGQPKEKKKRRRKNPALYMYSLDLLCIFSHYTLLSKLSQTGQDFKIRYFWNWKFYNFFF